MKKFLLLFCVFLVGCGGFVANFSKKELTKEQNIILNSGFENGDYNYTEVPKHWYVINKPEATIFWDNNLAHKGSKCLKVEYPNRPVNIISESFPAGANSVFYTRCYIKSEKYSKSAVTLHFYAFDDEGKKTDIFTKKIYPNKKWTPMEIDVGFLKSAAQFARVTIIFPEDRENVYWIDDIEVYKMHTFKKRK